MNWILDNLQLVIIVASAFAWWLTQRRHSSRDDQQPPTSPEEPPFDADERTRRIQDEIRRRIAERQGQATGRPTEPPPLVLSPAPTVQRPVATPPPLRRTEPDWTQADSAMLERQRRLEDEMRALEAQRRAARSSAQLATGLPSRVTAHSAEPSRFGGDRELLRLLRDRRSLRQAILLREVLGPPVALRGR